MIIKTEIKDLTEIFRDTQSKIIKKILKSGGKVFGFKLDNFKGLLGYELLPGRRIGTELAEVAKRYGLGGIFHSDELPAYGISEKEVKDIKKKLKCDSNDAFILIAGPEDLCIKVIRQIINRLNEMINKIPKDTRKINPDGTTSFLRPQPGSARMYPETDHPLIKLNRRVIERNSYTIIEYEIQYGDIKDKLRLIKLKLKEPHIINEINEEYDYILDLWDPEFRKKILESYGLNKKIVEDLLWSENLYLFEYLAKKYKKVKPTIIYYILEQVRGELKKKGIYDYKPDLKICERILKLLEEDKIVKDAIPEILETVIKENIDVDTAINKRSLWKISGEKLIAEIRKILEKCNEKDKNKIIKIVMSELRGRADPREIINILKSIIENDSKN